MESDDPGSTQSLFPTNPTQLLILALVALLGGGVGGGGVIRLTGSADAADNAARHTELVTRLAVLESQVNDLREANAAKNEKIEKIYELVRQRMDDRQRR